MDIDELMVKEDELLLSEVMELQDQEDATFSHHLSESAVSTVDSQSVSYIVEAVLLASASPVPLDQLMNALEHTVSEEQLKDVLKSLQDFWSHRGVELVEVATGWRFQTKSVYQEYLDRLKPEKKIKYSKALFEVLAVIICKQPVTRGDIENIRGVSVSGQVMKTLENRGWIECVGHRPLPGKPALFSTTPKLLEDFGIQSLEEFGLSSKFIN